MLALTLTLTTLVSLGFLMLKNNHQDDSKATKQADIKQEAQINTPSPKEVKWLTYDRITYG
jgi:hypothetical protein